jgi:hypothetical protein
MPQAGNKLCEVIANQPLYSKANALFHYYFRNPTILKVRIS